MGRSQPDERGAAAVEFALILTVLVALVLGIFEFGQGYSIKTELTGAVREGARALALGKTQGDAETAVRTAAPGLTSGSITYSQVLTCSPGSAGNGTIKASYPWSFNVYFLTGTRTITATGVMRCGV